MPANATGLLRDLLTSGGLAEWLKGSLGRLLFGPLQPDAPGVNLPRSVADAVNIHSARFVNLGGGRLGLSGGLSIAGPLALVLRLARGTSAAAGANQSAAVASGRDRRGRAQTTDLGEHFRFGESHLFLILGRFKKQVQRARWSKPSKAEAVTPREVDTMIGR
jgi:hypothetical protein